MRLFKFRIALITSLALFSIHAFAIDQVILKNGDVIQGKILADVPNRHVDIKLINGGTKRFSQAEVSSVERDVPSSQDRRMSGNQSEIYLGAQLGALINLGTITPGMNSTVFSWGARAGINVAQLGDFAKLALGLSFNHAETTLSGSTLSNNQIVGQILFRKVANTGFYFGPQAGIDLSSFTIASGSSFSYGLDAGYDYYFNDSFSVGPDVRYEHVGSGTLSYNGVPISTYTEANQLRIALTGTFHF